MNSLSPALRSALTASTDDRIFYDLAGIARRCTALLDELPGVAVRFAMKACPVDEVLAELASLGAGFDAAGPQEIAQALRTGVPADRVHYGNTVKSDRGIAEAYRLGIRTFATDSLPDVTAIARHAPRSRVFCRLATDGEGALWGLSRKFGCSPADAVRVLTAARDAGLTPAGLSVHVGSQQLTSKAWSAAFDLLGEVLLDLRRHGIELDHLNLGGGLPALGYLDRHGAALDPPLDEIFHTVRQGVDELRRLHGGALDFVLEPGRHLVADHGAVRAHVYRLTSRQQLDGEHEHWLYLSCGKFNGLYEMDQLQYRLVFPTHPDPAPDPVPAVVAGPTCDSDDTFPHTRTTGRTPVPRTLASGDPVWILSTGAYAVSYLTQGFNGFTPLPHTVLRPDPDPST
ncbi:type III PLP-dependent enzyme [Kitasatospora cheerisanensis]|uniref:ornithine decarboxylase n=1 Tax=Kitasatospora cheerisanensis KCTC 2395 TaxID=1348663 RepID=A0A066YLI2_9ACTN|nr:type III PLP-dependent enzyme [Kitasatospora cheerisanensis]KDN82323.1 putative decarboxylase [Kitasatospora cheerisanensis KCTC 2395]